MSPVLQGAGADADESSRMSLAKSELLANGLGVRYLQGGAARGLLFPAEDGTAFLEAGGEFLEEFVYHGYSVSLPVRQGEQ